MNYDYNNILDILVICSNTLSSPENRLSFDSIFQYRIMCFRGKEITNNSSSHAFKLFLAQKHVQLEMILTSHILVQPVKVIVDRNKLVCNLFFNILSDANHSFNVVNV